MTKVTLLRYATHVVKVIARTETATGESGRHQRRGARLLATTGLPNAPATGTLLQRFISEKLTTYDEPHRKGTPKGEVVGLSTVKYHAALLMLTSEPQMNVAEKLRVSFGLLRKWNTEKLFKEAVKTAREELAGVVVKRVRDTAAVPHVPRAIILKRGPTPSDLSSQKREVSHSFDDDFRDRGNYGPVVLEKIVEVIYGVVEEAVMLRDGKKLEKEIRLLMLLLNTFFIEIPTRTKAHVNILKSIALRLVQVLKHLYDKRTENGEMREAVLYSVECLRKVIEHLG